MNVATKNILIASIEQYRSYNMFDREACMQELKENLRRRPSYEVMTVEANYSLAAKIFLRIAHKL